MRLHNFALELGAGDPPAPDGAAHRFALSTRCVTALYERCFPRFMSSRGWKVLVECVPTVRDPAVGDLLGVLTVQRRFDLAAFLAAGPPRRKRLAFEALWAGIVEVAYHEGWPLEPFEQARRTVLELDLVNAWNWPRQAVRQAGTGRRALLRCEHETDAFRAAFLVRDRAGNELLRRPAFEEGPSDLLFVPRLGALTWTAPDRLTLTDRDGSLVAEVEVPGQRPA